MPKTMTPAALVCCENRRPKTAIAMAAQAICHFRSIASANRTPISGPTGAASAMMKVYSSERVVVIPCDISRVGTQLANP
jgi:molybdopterin-guanine dinucleotide biosynthesis protein A